MIATQPDQEGVTFEEWLENLSEDDRQRLVEYLIDADKSAPAKRPPKRRPSRTEGQSNATVAPLSPTAPDS
jgi:hypothetical protein